MKLMNRNKVNSFCNLIMSDYILSMIGGGNIMRKTNDVLVFVRLMANL